jgi:hypothetical protein
VTNLLLRSEEFDNAAWTKTNLTVSSNVIVAPNGTLTSDKLVEGSGSVTPILAQAVSVTSGASYTFTVYAKEDLTSAKRYLTLLLPSAQFGSNVRVTFNLANGTSVSTNNPDATSIIFVGDGWYRCSVTEAATSTGSAGVQIRVSNASPDTLTSYTGDGTSGLFIWGAQLEQSSTVGEYIPTVAAINSAPRFDHNPTTGESLGLLMEEARTNLLTYSEQFDNAGWTKANATITANESTAPDGTSTADLWTNTGSPGSISQNCTKDGTARTYSGSIWVKSSVTAFTIAVDDGSNSNRGRAQFNIETGVLSTAVNIGTFTNTSATITAYPDSWYRVTVTTTTSTGTTVRLITFFSNIGATARIWGAQLEEGAFPTSYIPTTTATVTRAADVASITGTNFSSFYNQTEGTVFAEAISVATNTSVFSISDNSTNNRIQLETGSNTRRFRITSSGSARYDNSVSYTFGTQGKTAGAYLATSTNHATNGTLGSNSTASPLPVVDRIYIGSNAAGSLPNNGTIKRLTYWPTRLADTTLQQITQP